MSTEWNLDNLIEELTAIRNEHADYDGEVSIRIAYQGSFPLRLRGCIQEVMPHGPGETLDSPDNAVVWLAVDQVDSLTESPHVPRDV